MPTTINLKKGDVAIIINRDFSMDIKINLKHTDTVYNNFIFAVGILVKTNNDNFVKEMIAWLLSDVKV